ncbi:hypothetical protein [Methylobacterium sp. SD21]|jgi:uncharacterized membrane protein
MLAFSQSFVHRHREEVAVLVSSATFLVGALSLVWLVTLRI